MMKKKRLISAVLALLLIPLLVVPAFAEAVPGAVIKASDSVVRIFVDYKRDTFCGSGFVVSSDKTGTLIATNYHVVEGSPTNISVLIDGQEVSATREFYSESKDLCVLRINTPLKVKVAALSSGEVKRGDAVYAVGYPAAADYLSASYAISSDETTITNGVVSSVRDTTFTAVGGTLRLIQMNADINQGNSGGPLFDEKGRVVGINTLLVNDSPGVCGAVAVGELISLAGANGVKLGGSNVPAIVAGAALVLLAAAVIIIVIKAKKKHLRPAAEPKAYTDSGYQSYEPVGRIADSVVVIPNQKAAKKRKKVHVSVVVGSVLAAVVALYFGAYGAAHILAYMGSFKIADTLIPAKKLTVLFDKKLIRYIDAGIIFESGDYSNAVYAFENLDEYKKAGYMANKSKYYYAGQLAGKGDFEAAIEIYSNLPEDDFHEADTKKYELLTKVYDEGVNLYHRNDYSKAEQKFKISIKDNYKESKPYYTLCKLHNGEVVFKEEFDFLIGNYFGLEDVSRVIFYGNIWGVYFLQGNWKTSDGDMYFKLDESGEATYNLPAIPPYDYCTIRNGMYMSYSSLVLWESKTKDIFKFTALGPDEIKIYCFENGETYTLYRQ